MQNTRFERSCVPNCHICLWIFGGFSAYCQIQDQSKVINYDLRVFASPDLKLCGHEIKKTPAKYKQIEITLISKKSVRKIRGFVPPSGHKSVLAVKILQEEFSRGGGQELRQLQGLRVQGMHRSLGNWTELQLRLQLRLQLQS